MMPAVSMRVLSFAFNSELGLTKTMRSFVAASCTLQTVDRSHATSVSRWTTTCGRHRSQHARLQPHARAV